MKISIVTPSYNQGAFIGQTIQSILSQGIDDLEFIVADGGSTDGTLEILKQHEGKVTWFSEPDRGMADAINKGIARATGDIIGWLNTDDIYLDGTLNFVKDYFSEHPDCQWLCGKCRIIDKNGREIWKYATWYKNLFLKKFSYRNLLRENFISQPAVFFRKDLIGKVGPLNTGLRFAMDYDLWLRFGKVAPAHFTGRYLSLFRRHGESKSVNDFKEQFLEQYRVALSNNPGFIDRKIHLFNIYKIILVYMLINRK
jgi:glycosyltransferase involved in cell wall biosynthesis